MHKYFTLICLILAAAGCTAAGRSAPTPDWQLSPRASAIYNYLKFNEYPNSKQGIDALKESINNEPRPYLYLELANLYWRRTDFASAREILKQGIGKYPQQKDLYISLAKSYLAEDRKQAALTTILDCLDKNPGEWGLIEDAASLYLQEDQCANALDLLKKIPEEEATANSEYLKGKSQGCLGLYKSAVEHLKTAVEKDPEMAKAWAELAYVHEKNRNYARAESIYRKLMDMQQKNDQLLLRIISLDLKLNEPDRAMLIVEQGPDDPDFQLDAAGQFITNKYFEHAGRILKKLLNREDTPERTYIHLAILAYDSQKDIDSALNYLDKIPEDSPLYERSLRLKGSFELEIDDRKKALKTAEKGIREFPDNPAFWNLKAQVLSKTGEKEEALNVLDKALEKWPRSTDTLIYKATVLQEAGKQDQALEVMEKVIGMEPDNAEALNFVGYLLAEKEENLERARVLVKNALKQEPSNGFYMDSLAWVLFKQGRIQKAWEKISLAVDLVGEDPVIWMHYGDIAMAVKNWKEAVSGYKKALELGLDPAEESSVKKKLSRARDKQSTE